jgi:hypothetical protein
MHDLAFKAKKGRELCPDPSRVVQE